MTRKDAGGRVALLLMGYGSPGGPGEIADYLADVIHRRPSEAMVQEYQRRYGLIGGSPQARILRSLRDRVERRWHESHPESAVYLGVKHWTPNIADVVPKIVADGFDRIVAIPLSPYASTWILEPYQAALEAGRRAAARPFDLDLRAGWHLEPALIGYWARSIREGLARLDPGTTFVFLSAHSLPGRYADRGDPYPSLLRATCDAIAREGKLARWEFTYQSAGNTTEPWLGPDITERIVARRAEGFRSMLVAPFGFVFEHLEVLYDLDIVVREFARGQDMAYHRSALPNDSTALVEALVHVASTRAGVTGDGPEPDAPG